MSDEYVCRLKFRKTKCKGIVYSCELEPGKRIITCVTHATWFHRLKKLSEWGVTNEQLAKWSEQKIIRQYTIKKDANENKESVVKCEDDI